MNQITTKIMEKSRPATPTVNVIRVLLFIGLLTVILILCFSCSTQNQLSFRTDPDTRYFMQNLIIENMEFERLVAEKKVIYTHCYRVKDGVCFYEQSICSYDSIPMKFRKADHVCTIKDTVRSDMFINHLEAIYVCQ